MIKSFLVEEDYITSELADEVFVTPENVVGILGDTGELVWAFFVNLLICYRKLFGSYFFLSI